MNNLNMKLNKLSYLLKLIYKKGYILLLNNDYIIKTFIMLTLIRRMIVIIYIKFKLKDFFKKKINYYNNIKCLSIKK